MGSNPPTTPENIARSLAAGATRIVLLAWAAPAGPGRGPSPTRPVGLSAGRPIADPSGPRFGLATANSSLGLDQAPGLVEEEEDDDRLARDPARRARRARRFTPASPLARITTAPGSSILVTRLRY